MPAAKKTFFCGGSKCSSLRTNVQSWGENSKRELSACSYVRETAYWRYPFPRKIYIQKDIYTKCRLFCSSFRPSYPRLRINGRVILKVCFSSENVEPDSPELKKKRKYMSDIIERLVKIDSWTIFSRSDSRFKTMCVIRTVERHCQQNAMILSLTIVVNWNDDRKPAAAITFSKHVLRGKRRGEGLFFAVLAPLNDHFRHRSKRRHTSLATKWHRVTSNSLLETAATLFNP